MSGVICFCLCGGSIGSGTVLNAEGKPVPFALAAGEAVLAAGLSLDFEPAILEHVAAAPPRRLENMVLMGYRLDGVEISRVVHADTPLLTKTGGLLPASRLQLDDRLVDRNGEAVVIERLVWGAFDGIVPDIATMLTPPDSDFDGHLLVVDGVVTGDYAVQLFASPLIEPGRGGLMHRLRKRPSIGSRAWEVANGRSGRGYANEGVVGLDHGTFYPADLLTTRPPANAVSLLREDTRLAEREGDAVLEDLDILERARAALNPRATRAKLELLIDWYANGEDALTWRDDEGMRHLLIQGGLLRRDEAVALKAGARLFDRLR